MSEHTRHGAGDVATDEREVEVVVEGARLPGFLGVPKDARGIVVFCHGSGSSRHSDRNRFVASALRRRRMGTLLFDLLTSEEGEDRRLVFDIAKLAGRTKGAVKWLRERPETEGRAIGLFGASTGAAAALVAEARSAGVAAIVSRGGRPDLAEEALEIVRAPTMLIIGGQDHACIPLNQDSFERLACEKRYEVVDGATHLFEEPGTLERAAQLAGDWFERWFARDQERERAGRREGL